MSGSKNIRPLLDRADFPTLNAVTYLNQASLGLAGQPAVDAMNLFLENVGRHGNTFMSDEDEVAFLGDLRERAAQLCQSHVGQIAILSGASELLGQVPFMLDLRKGSKVIAVSSDFPAVTRPWLRLAEREGCILDFVDDKTDSDLTDDLIARIDSDTALVTVGSVQYSTGTKVDIPRLRAATAAVGARLVVDATQEVGTREIAIGSWEADVVVFSGYKWLGGHGGVAIGVIGQRFLNESPAMPGWMSAPDPFDFDATRLGLAVDARRFTQSTISYVSAAGLNASVGQLLEVGLDPIRRSAEYLAGSMVDQLQPRGWHPLRPLEDHAASAHIVSLGRQDTEIEEVLHHLRSDNIVVSGRLGRLRVSIAPYNNESDIAALVGSLGQI